mgnify:FL=1
MKNYTKNILLTLVFLGLTSCDFFDILSGDLDGDYSGSGYTYIENADGSTLYMIHNDTVYNYWGESPEYYIEGNIVYSIRGGYKEYTISGKDIYKGTYYPSHVYTIRGNDICDKDNDEIVYRIK